MRSQNENSRERFVRERERERKRRENVPAHPISTFNVALSVTRDLNGDLTIQLLRSPHGYVFNVIIEFRL